MLRMIGEHVKAGVTTNQLDRLCHDYIVHVQQAVPANVGYHGYPKTICASVNQGDLSRHPVRCAAEGWRHRQYRRGGDGDGWYGDSSRMYCVGKPSGLARRLVRTTYDAMRAGILQVRPGATLGDVGYAIQRVAQREGFSVVREYCGHGIGRIYHDEPQVLHYGQPAWLTLKAGMVFTIEPMINAGRPDIRQLATAGPWSPATTACRRSGSIWWRSPSMALKC